MNNTKDYIENIDIRKYDNKYVKINDEFFTYKECLEICEKLSNLQNELLNILISMKKD